MSAFLNAFVYTLLSDESEDSIILTLRNRLFNSVSKKYQAKMHNKWQEEFKENIKIMQEMMNKTKWTNKEDRYKTENVVNTFVNTSLNYLYWMSSSVIGILDTTNPFDATFKLLKFDKRLGVCYKFSFMVPKNLLFQTTQEDNVYVKCAIGLLNELGDETSESSAERVRNNDNCNGNGHIPDYRLRVTDVYERLERESADDTVVNIYSEINKQFTKINLFAIQPIVNSVFYRLQKFVTLSIPFSSSHAKKVEPFIMSLLKFQRAIGKSATKIAGIAEAIRRDRKELYSIITNSCERTRILLRFTTPSTPPHD
ncbi:122_t:CDS:2 [Scutellospora calospora]|uniref:122_t:CDS:1 n=1 Tax=Scutellospora calospora TaxID=85575 RepID=A0ACA9K3S0_9GLOM|nr:122_t:CDS:2 [Scutellospora calospora]